LAAKNVVEDYSSGLSNREHHCNGGIEVNSRNSSAGDQHPTMFKGTQEYSKKQLSNNKNGRSIVLFGCHCVILLCGGSFCSTTYMFIRSSAIESYQTQYDCVY
jgi:hypothetical protein